jgi:lysozyme
MLGVVGCASQPPISLPPTSPAPAVLQAYSLEELLIHHEGLRLKPYVDSANKLTIGVGRNLADTGITEQEALYLLHNDVQRASRELDGKLPWWRDLSETRRRVMVSMVFNLGMSRLLDFHDMLSAAQEGDYSAAAKHMLDSRWASQVGRRAVELAYLMENG